jgi:HSP20 family protein
MMAKEVVETEVTPVRRGPLSVVPKFEHELERFFGERWPRALDVPFLRSSIDTNVPKVDVVDREGEVFVRAELPGFSKEEIDVSVNDSTLTIKATHESDQEDSEEDYYRREIACSFVSRTVSLPAEVDGAKAKATLKDGLLEFTVPKMAKSKRQKVKIED